MKTKSCVLAFIFFVVLVYLPVSADDISIYFEGGFVDTAVKPITQNERTFVPIALIADMLGAETKWIDGEARQVEITQDEKKLNIYIGSTYMEYNTVPLTSDAAPFIFHDRTMVPLRIISEYLGFDVTYNDVLKRVDINKQKKVFYNVQENGAVDIYGKYSRTQDIMVRIEPCGTNSLPDFSAVYLIYNDNSDISTCLSAGAFAVYERSTDWHSPFIINAKNNPFGGDKYSFTGGNHGYQGNEGGAHTAHLLSMDVEADGQEVKSGCGLCSDIKIKWANAVQGSNTKEPSGWGRAVLEEQHTLSFDGETFFSEVTLVPYEEIEIDRVYGFSAEIKNVWDETVEYEYPQYKEIKDAAAASAASERGCVSVTCRRGNNALRISLDTDYGLGKREYLSELSKGAFAADYGKVYFELVNGKAIDAAKGEQLSYRGSYKFFSAEK